jgi:hypothetical protein
MVTIAASAGAIEAIGPMLDDIVHGRLVPVVTGSGS